MADDRSRVEKLVGLLGSEHGGGLAAAAGMLDREARAKRLTMVEFLRAALQISAESKSESRSGPKPWREGGSPLDQLAQAVRFKSVLSEWEQHFASDILGRYGSESSLSGKQRVIIEKIVAKARRCATAGHYAEND